MHRVSTISGRLVIFFQFQQDAFSNSIDDKSGKIFKVIGIQEIVGGQFKRLERQSIIGVYHLLYRGDIKSKLKIEPF